MSDETRETELEKALREAEEAEAKLRQLKESLISKEHAAALDDLMKAEMRAMTERVMASFTDWIVAAKTEAESAAVIAEMQTALLAGADRVEAAVLEQLRAWTIAGLEDRKG